MKCIIDESGNKVEYKVKRMNYDQIVINIGKDMKVYPIENIELIPENEIDEFLISNKDFLKIKLKRGMSVNVYTSLHNSLKEKYNEEIEEINLLKDKYELLNKRGFWQKNMLMLINEKYPIKVDITGKNFHKDGYEINIYEYTKKEFLNICNDEIKRIEKEINDKNKILSRYGKAILDIKEKNIILENNLIT